MKILIASDAYKSNLGGVATSILALTKGLRYYGHEVKILTLSSHHKSYKDGDEYYVKSIPAFYYPEMRMSFAMRDPFLRELSEWKPDIIHLQTEGSARWFANKIIKMCNVPIVMTCHTDYGHFIFGKGKNLPPIKAFLSAIGGVLYRKATKVIAPSQKAAEFPFIYKSKNYKGELKSEKFN